MSKTVQFKRGNANVSASYVGAQGEITVNTDNYTLNVHDGTTPGGYSILNTNVSNIGNLVVTNQTITGTSANTNITLSPTNANVVLTSNLVTPNIIINRNTIQSIDSETSLKLPATSDGTNVELVNNFSNIKFTVLDTDTDEPHTLTLDRDSYLTIPGYIRSTLGGGEIQFGGTQGVLVYANFNTGTTGISLNDVGTTDIFANGDLRFTANYAGISRPWTLSTNGTFSSSGNLSTANLLISHISASNTVQARTLSNSDLKLTATDGTYESSIYLWANNQRMSFNTVSNAFDFNFNGQLSATDFTASKNSNVGYSFYAEGGDYSGFRHTSGPPDLITIVHEGNVFAGFYGNYTTQLYGNLVVSSDGETFGSFPDAYVQVYSNVDTYSQFVLQNINDGVDASTDVVITADNGDDSTYYINMGILGSNHAVEDFFGDVRNYDDGYLIVVGNDATGGAANVGNLILGSTNGIVKTFVGNIAEANVVTVVSEGLFTVAGNINGTNLLGAQRVYANTAVLGYGTDGSGLIGAPIVISGNSTTSIIGTNGIANNVSSNLTIKTLNSNISLQLSGVDKTWTFDTTGDLTVPNYINFEGNTYIGDETDWQAFRIVAPLSYGVTIETDSDISGNSWTWTFGLDGILGSPGNITAPNFIGNIAGSDVVGTVSLATTAGGLANGNSIVSIPTADGNIYVGVNNIGSIEFTADGINTLNLASLGNVTASASITAGGTITAANISANVNGYSIGYRDVPQVVFTSNATLALTDAGKHYYSSNSANVITIPNNSTVSFNIGAAISVVQEGTANLTVSPDSGVTLYLAGNSTSGSRTLGNYGMATLLKVATDTWFISGTGVN